VICTLGTRQGDEPVEAQSARLIVQAMQQHGVLRLIVVTSLGVGDSRDQVPGFFKVLMKTALRKVMAAKEEQERVVKESGLDWVIVRPGGLTDGPLNGRYTFGLDKSIMAGQVTRADVADFVLRQLTDDTFLHKTPAIT
ncbi:MAG: SDR family oxidoreductase, partial [Anaerolineales bacterium]|nr:SDR family oxidoreductase [Anaerolineales bacterium]